jgi:hypothetical protein
VNILASPGPSDDVCFLCGRNPISWPGNGLCEPCFQETADLEHRGWAEMYECMSPAERAEYDARCTSYGGCQED